ncbi:MAG: MFS transporter [Bacteroidota bacterium]|nr:MFS transporter [Bacteroidota bacterium]
MKSDKKVSISIFILCILFFQIGALFCMNDVIFPIVKEQFQLTFVQTTMIQLIFYAVYIPFPLLIEKIVSKFGYIFSLKIGILFCFLGSATFGLLNFEHTFLVILASLFLLSFGIVVMNTAAMPYTALIGNENLAQFRTNLVQVFSRLGYSAAPLAANYLIFLPGNFGGLDKPYLLLSVFFMIILVLIFTFKLPDPHTIEIQNLPFKAQFNKMMQIPHLYFGVIAMFFYLGAEAGTASFFMNYLMDKNIASFSIEKATLYLTYYNVASTVMGFIGLGLIKYFPANRVLALFGIIMIILLSICITMQSDYIPMVLVSVGGFLSIMFPTVYGLAIRNLGNFSSFGAAWVSMAIAGGAFFPVIQGYIADNFGVRLSYSIPAICVGYVVVYAMFLSKVKVKST